MQENPREDPRMRIEHFQIVTPDDIDRAIELGVLPAMQRCREHCDALERMICADHWPLPSYAEMLWMH